MIPPPTASHRSRSAGFGSTDWTVILQCQGGDAEKSREALEKIVQRYWRPIYVFLRQKRLPPEQARDLVQGFICEVVLDRKLIEHADRAQGRFRTFLLAALQRFAVSDYRAQNAQKRHAGTWTLPLEAVERLDYSLKGAPETPEEAFDRVWAAQLLDDVLAELRDGYQKEGRSNYWSVFEAKVVDPILHGVAPPPLGRLCEQFGIDQEQRASNMIATAKRRFRAMLFRRLRPLVSQDADVDDEIKALMQTLSRRGAR
ncbi:MAG: sigma-70 family RNA polymerase sigma factor [Planctomycetota bacterium]|nr:sigma-70 family RNA polymerase sigma factor [Planctomycetota bacterium]